MQKSKTEPWMPADDYGRSLPVFTVNLLVTDVAREVDFCKAVLKSQCHYQDEDFAALNVHGTEFMLHADHTYDVHPWVEPLKARERRGLGAELRILGVDPDEVESASREFGADIVHEAADKPHGWREVMVADPEGYIWAVGVKLNGDSAAETSD